MALQQDNGLFPADRDPAQPGDDSKKTGARVAEDARQIRDPDLPVAPTFSSFCAQCEFKAAMRRRHGSRCRLARAILEANFFQRDKDSEDESLRHSGPPRAPVRHPLGGMFRVINLGHR